MNSTAKFCLVAALGVFLSTGANASLRVLSYNIFHCEGTDNVVDIDRIADIIGRSGADLVALQEVDRMTTRSGIRNEVGEIGRRLGMEPRFERVIKYAGGEYGIALLSRYPIVETIRHALPTPEGMEPRHALEVVVDVPCGHGQTNRISFICAHLGLTNDQRVEQVKALLQSLENRGHPVILAGDFNAEPQERSVQLLEEAGFRSFGDPKLFTFPAPAPVKTIDYIMARDLPVRDATFEVIDERKASDHRPIFCEIELGK